MKSSLFELISVALCVYFLGSALAKSSLGWFVLVVLCAACIFSAIVLYLLKFERQHALRLHQLPIVANLMDLVCRIEGVQVPVSAETDRVARQQTQPRVAPGSPSPGGAPRDLGPSANGPSAGLMLTSPEGFRSACRQIKEAVRGHDAAVETILNDIEQSVLLRAAQRPGSQHPPLASFLLVGPPGIGKRYMAQAVGELLYKNGGFFSLDMASLTESERAVGVLAGRTGSLISTVKGRPNTVVLLENADMIPTSGIQALSNLLRTGVCVDPENKSAISFQNSVIFLTTTKAVDLLRAGCEAAKDQDDWIRRAADALSSETSFDLLFLSQLSAIVILNDPTDWTKAEVIALLMDRECSRFSKRLDYVAPEIIVHEVRQISEQYGFATVPARVSKLLKEPVVEASRRQSGRIILEHDIAEGLQDLEVTERYE